MVGQSLTANTVLIVILEVTINYHQQVNVWACFSSVESTTALLQPIFGTLFWIKMGPSPIISRILSKYLSQRVCIVSTWILLCPVHYLAMLWVNLDNKCLYIKWAHSVWEELFYFQQRRKRPIFIGVTFKKWYRLGTSPRAQWPNGPGPTPRAQWYRVQLCRASQLLVPGTSTRYWYQYQVPGDVKISDNLTALHYAVSQPGPWAWARAW